MIITPFRTIYPPKDYGTNLTTMIRISSTTLTTVKERLTKAYIHVCSKGTITAHDHGKAIQVIAARFEYLKLTYGCAHSETLTILLELVNMHLKFRTKESVTIVTKILLDSTLLILFKETGSKALFEAAKRIGGIYRSCGLVEEGRKFLRELHLQIIFKSRNPGCGFAVEKAVGRTSLVFLATFEEIMLGSITISYSKIMAELLTETILFESYQRSKIEKDVGATITVGARLYVFLEKSSRKEQIVILQEETLGLFTKTWGNAVKTNHETTRIFVTSLLRVLGSTTRKITIGDAACRSSNSSISQLLLSGEVHKAYEVGLCAFKFAENQGAYHHMHNVGYGFKLSSLMASRSLGKDTGKSEDSELHAKMLELSRKIISQVLKACKDSKVNFARMKLSELNDLVALLGNQKNFADLDVRITQNSLVILS